MIDNNVTFIVSIVFVRLDSGDNSCNESIVLHYTIACLVFITQQRCAIKLTREFLVLKKITDLPGKLLTMSITRKRPL